MTAQAQLDEFIDEHEEELFERDPGSFRDTMSEADIEEIADHLMMQVLEAPVVSIAAR